MSCNFSGCGNALTIGSSSAKNIFFEPENSALANCGVVIIINLPYQLVDTDIVLLFMLAIQLRECKHNF